MATSLSRCKIFDRHHSIARPRKPPVRRKHLRDISYTSRVIADFVLNFVAMATRVGRGRICLTLLNSPTPVPPTRSKRHRDIFYTSGVIACYVSIFVAMATGLMVAVEFVWRHSIALPDPEKPCYTQKSRGYLLLLSLISVTGRSM